MGLAVGVGADGQDGPPRARAARATAIARSTSRRVATASVMQVEGILGTGLMPGVFAQAGMEYAYEHGGVGFEQFAKVAEKNHAHSTLNPLAQYQKAFIARRGHGRRDDGVPEHAAHVLPHGRRRRGRGPGLRGEAEHAVRRAAAARRQDVGLGAHLDPWTERDQVQPDVNTLTARTRPTRPTRSRASTRRTSTSSSCTTASRPPSSSTTTTCGSASRARQASSSTSGARGATATTPVNVSGGLISKGHPLGATGIANVYEVDDPPAR